MISPGNPASSSSFTAFWEVAGPFMILQLHFSQMHPDLPRSSRTSGDASTRPPRPPMYHSYSPGQISRS